MLGAVLGRVGGDTTSLTSAEEARADQELVQRMAARDGEALARLYDRHCRSIYSLAFHILGEQADAEDVVQDVFSQAWAQARRYEAKRGAVAAWLLTIARSRAIDRVRSRRTRPGADAANQTDLSEVVDPGEPQDSDLLSKDRISRLRDAMARLPVMQRVVVEMAYFEGLTQAEIASRLDEPLGTVKTRARLALLKLRAAMTEPVT